MPDKNRHGREERFPQGVVVQEEKFVVVLECPLPEGGDTVEYVNKLLFARRSELPRGVVLHVAIREVADEILSFFKEA